MNSQSEPSDPEMAAIIARVRANEPGAELELQDALLRRTSRKRTPATATNAAIHAVIKLLGELQASEELELDELSNRIMARFNAVRRYRRLDKKRRSKAGKRSDPEHPTVQDEFIGETAIDSRHPRDHVEDEELFSLLWEGISRLEGPEAEIIRQRYFEDQAATEVAAIYGCSRQMIHRRLRKALSQLRALLPDDLADE